MKYLGKTSEKTSEKINDDCEIDNNDDLKFNRKRDITITIIIAVLVFITVVSFKYLIPIFPVTMGLLIGFIGIVALLLLDRFILPGNTTKRISRDAIAVSITYLSFAIMFVCGFQFGNSYVTNSYGNDTEGSQAIIRESEPTNKPSPNNQSTTVTRSDGIILPKRSGSTEREQ